MKELDRALIREHTTAISNLPFFADFVRVRQNFDKSEAVMEEQLLCCIFYTKDRTLWERLL